MSCYISVISKLILIWWIYDFSGGGRNITFGTLCPHTHTLTHRFTVSLMTSSVNVNALPPQAEIRASFLHTLWTSFCFLSQSSGFPDTEQEQLSGWMPVSEGSSDLPGYVYTHPHSHSHTHTHTYIWTIHICNGFYTVQTVYSFFTLTLPLNTHTRTHKWGLSINVMIFILYNLYILSLHLHLFI